MKLKSTLSILFLLLVTITNAQSKEGLQTINGTKLFVKEDGKGEVLLVIHGGPGLSHDYFVPHLDPLAKKFKVVYYDQRASGQSAIPSADSISMDFFVDDIEGIRKMLGVEKINLLAHSWGALLAVQYGIKYPNQVDKIILSNPVPLNLEYQKQSGALLQQKTTKQDSIDRATLIASAGFKNHEVATTEELLKVIFRPSFYNRTNLPKLNLALSPTYHQATPALYTGLGKDLQSYDYYDAVKAFSFPVLLIAGKADNIPIEAIERIQKNIQGSKLMVFEKSGHFPFIEEPSQFNQAVLKFLKE